MTYYVSSGMLNPTHSLTHSLLTRRVIKQDKATQCNNYCFYEYYDNSTISMLCDHLRMVSEQKDSPLDSTCKPYWCWYTTPVLTALDPTPQLKHCTPINKILNNDTVPPNATQCA